MSVKVALFIMPVQNVTHLQISTTKSSAEKHKNVGAASARLSNTFFLFFFSGKVLEQSWSNGDFNF